MRIAIDKSAQLNNFSHHDSKMEFIPDTKGRERKSCFYDFGVERNIEFLGFSDRGNSRFVDSLFKE